MTDNLVRGIWLGLLNNTNITEEDSSWAVPVVADYTHSENTIRAIIVFVVVAASSRLIIMNKKQRTGIPGPTPLPFIGNALLLSVKADKLLPILSNLLKQYGGIMALKIGFSLNVLISNPEDIEIFCNSKKLMDKSDQYGFVKPILGNGVFSSNGAPWKKGRKLILPSLRPQNLKEILPIFLKQTETLVKLLWEKDGAKEFDILPFIRNCTYDMIFEVILGIESNSQTVHCQALDDTEEIMDLMFQRALKFWLQWDTLYFLLPCGRRFKQLVNNLNRHNRKNITHAFISADAKSGTGHDTGEPLVHHLRTQLGDLNEIQEHIVTMLVTGYDTSAGTLGFVLLMLGMHMDVQNKVLEEVVRLRSGPATNYIYEYPYLEMVIKETLRLFPVGPLIFRRASDDVAFGNIIVPKGSTVTCNIFNAHRDEKSFVSPNTFNPENFLPEVCRTRHPYAYIPFSAGTRGCIGTKYGMISMKVIIAEMVYHYQIFCDRSFDDIKLKPEITMKSANGYNIRVHRRRS